jgi:hypothetical protein
MTIVVIRSSCWSLAGPDPAPDGILVVMSAGRKSRHTVTVSIETGSKKMFATAVDWPGWSRSGKTEELALDALASAAPRYAIVAREAGEPFDAADYEIVEHVEGGGGTDFGVPSSIPGLDRRPVTATEAKRLARIVEVAWTVLDRVAASAPAELRKGPRGGGRDRDKMIGHVIESDWYYAREIGLKAKQPGPTDRPTIEGLRAAVLEVLRQPSDGSPLADRKWPQRYAAHRIAWHALDHAWEMEDRSDPA